MIFLGLEYASDGPELSNEEIERQFAELESKLFLEIESRLRREGRNDRIEQLRRSKEKKIASLRVSTISPVIASSRYALFPSRPRAEVAVSD